METNLLSAADLLAGSKAVQDVLIPLAVLQPVAAQPDAGGPSAPPNGAQAEHLGAASPTGPSARCVRLRPLSIAVLTLISRAARDDAGLIPLLMIKEALVEPALSLDQIRQLHVGLVYFLVGEINRLSGLAADGTTLDAAADSPLGRTHLLLARHFGWTPEQVGQLTPGQVAVYLAGIEKLLQLERLSAEAGEP